MKKQIQSNEETIIKKNDKIVYLRLFKIVAAIGTGGHIMIPRELIGKKVIIEYRSKEK